LLEDRLVPATFLVTTTLDVVDAADGKLSLREAISAANANPGADTVIVPAGVYRIALPGADDVNAAGDFDVTGSTVFRGAGAGNTVIDGQRLDRVFDVRGTAANSISVTFQGLTIRNGLADDGGGGIRVGNADLTVQDCAVTDNRTTGFGGGISNAALAATGNVKLVRSTVARNVAGQGGGVVVLDTPADPQFVLTVRDSTIEHNLATAAGGIFAVKVNLTGSTVSGNQASVNNGGGIEVGVLTSLSATVTENSAHTGGGVFLSKGATARLRKTIIAQNFVDLNGTGPDVSGAFAGGDRLLIGDSSGSTGLINGENGSQVGTAADPIDARLGPLADNGGPTLTHALLPGSPAIDRGEEIELPATDQRGAGFPHVAGAGPDIGAFEVQPPPPAPPDPPAPGPAPVRAIFVTFLAVPAGKKRVRLLVVERFADTGGQGGLPRAVPARQVQGRQGHPRGPQRRRRPALLLRRPQGQSPGRPPPRVRRQRYREKPCRRCPADIARQGRASRPAPQQGDRDHVRVRQHLAVRQAGARAERGRAGHDRAVACPSRRTPRAPPRHRQHRREAHRRRLGGAHGPVRHPLLAPLPQHEDGRRGAVPVTGH
jgi:CSLREA domain-containing protein